MVLTTFLAHKTFFTLWDTGASRSFIHSNTLQQFPQFKVNKEHRFIKNSNGQLSSVNESVILPIRLTNGFHGDFKFFVTNEVNYPLIFGMDIITSMKPVIDFSTNEVKFQHQPVPFKDYEIINKTITLKLDHPLVLPARSELTMPHDVHFGHRVYAFVERYDSFATQSGAILAEALVKCSNGRVPLRLLNPTNRDIVIPAHRKIGRLVPFENIVLNDIRAFNIDITKEEFFKLFKFEDLKLEDKILTRLKNVLWKWKHVFVFGSNGNLGSTDLVEHAIDTNDQIIRQAPYRIPYAYRDEAKNIIDKMLQNGVVTMSSSSYSSPVVLVKKKDGSLRFCVDYRKLNEITRKDVYPLPRIDDMFTLLNGNCYFSGVDADSGFWQIKVKRQDQQKTAFSTPFGLFEFRRMPFGLCNAPATFQRLMDVVLSGLLWDICLVYMDDIIIFGQTLDEHFNNLETVFAALASAGITLKPSKCRFCQRELPFLGHIVSEKGIATDPAKIATVRDAQIPKNITELRSFLGLSGYYRKFVKNYAKHADPLIKLTRSEEKFIWTNNQQAAFDKLKAKLIKAPILAYPDFNRPFTLFTDASSIGLGAVLSQTFDDNKERVIAYWSETLTPGQRNWSATERESLAMLHAVKNFRYFLLGRKFQLVVDHKSLVFKMTDANSKLIKHAIQLQEYDFDVIYRSGKSHTNADAMSRPPIIFNNINDDSTPFSEEDLRKNQRLDPTIALIMEYLEKNIEPKSQKEKQQLKRVAADLIIDNGILYRVWKPFGRALDEQRQIFLPLHLRPKILKIYHDSIIGSHLGFFKTLNKIRQRFYWFGMLRDVHHYVTSCESCTRRKSHHEVYGKLKNIPITEPFDTIGMDILGPFKETRHGHKYILVITDYASKWVEAFPLCSIASEDIARIIAEEILCRHGCPARILTDQADNFNSELMQQIYKMLDSKKIRTVAYHPQTDGLTEKFNHTLAKMLTPYVNDFQDDWDEYLRFVLFSYNTAVHESTKFEPFYLLYGRNARLPIPWNNISPLESHDSYDGYAKELLNRMAIAKKIANSNVAAAQRHQKKNYDKRRKDESKIPPNSTVWYTKYKLEDGTTAKLAYKNDGPYVLKKIDGLNAEIALKENPAYVKRVNVSQIRIQKPRRAELEENDSLSSTDKPNPPPFTLEEEILREDTPIKRQRQSSENQLVQSLQLVRDSIKPTSSIAPLKKNLNQLVGLASTFTRSTSVKERNEKLVRQCKTAAELTSLIDTLIQTYASED